MKAFEVAESDVHAPPGVGFPRHTISGRKARKLRKTCDALVLPACNAKRNTRQPEAPRKQLDATLSNKKFTPHHLSHLAFFPLAVLSRFFLSFFAAAALALFAWLWCAIAPAVSDSAKTAKGYIVPVYK